MLSEHLELLTLFPGLDRQLPKKLHFLAAFLHYSFRWPRWLYHFWKGPAEESQVSSNPSSSPEVIIFCSPHSMLSAAERFWPSGTKTTKQWLVPCLPSRNLLSGGNNAVLNKKLLLFQIKQKMLLINHLIPELCFSISLSLLLSFHLLLTVFATRMSLNAVSLQNGFLIK